MKNEIKHMAHSTYRCEHHKVFKGWENEKGKIVSTDKTYTFTVTGEITLNAVYNNVSVAKKGLSGGAIAGIAVGSTAVAGFGGFSVFWFAIKKKIFCRFTFRNKNVVYKKVITKKATHKGAVNT